MKTRDDPAVTSGKYPSEASFGASDDFVRIAQLDVSRHADLVNEMAV